MNERNPSINNILEIANLLTSLNFNGLEDVSRLTEDALKLRTIYFFNELFKDEAWVLNNYLTPDTVYKAVIAKNDGCETYNQFLIEAVENGFTNFFIHLETVSDGIFHKRQEVFKVAKQNYDNENYISTIPLLLILADGITKEVTGYKGGMSYENSDIDAWDSIVQYDNGLSHFHKIFITTRQKINTDPIYLPYRHGILHGVDINFGNKLLAAKCWNLIFTLKTWHNDRKDENFKRLQIERDKHLSEDNSQIEHYQRKYDEQNKKNYESHEGHDVLKVFFESWKNSKWNFFPNFVHDISNSKRDFNDIKETYSKRQITEFEILSQTTHTSSKLSFNCKVLCDNKFLDLTPTLWYVDEEMNPLPAEHPKGTWCINQCSISEFLFSCEEKNNV